VTDDGESRRTDLSEFVDPSDRGADAEADADGADADVGRDGGGDAGRDGGRADHDVPAVADLDREGRVDLGVDLLGHLDGEPSLSAVVDRLETVTTDPSLTRAILDAAEKRGVIDRDGARLRTRSGGGGGRGGPRVVRREGEFTCRRCGAGLSTGHFLRFETGELGPFGSSCVEKVTGRG
jgi:hypothetical protein